MENSSGNPRFTISQVSNKIEKHFYFPRPPAVFELSFFFGGVQFELEPVPRPMTVARVIEHADWLGQVAASLLVLGTGSAGPQGLRGRSFPQGKLRCYDQKRDKGTRKRET